jgi:cytochrome oxidase Cu insertion factor (SCO1/SenC/PrrC family)
MLVAVALLVWRVLSTGRPTEPQGVERGSAGMASASGSEERAAGEGREPADAPLTSIPGTFTDQDGHVRTLASLRGVPFVASAIYPRCPSVCPRTVAALHRLDRSLPVGDRPRYVLFSLDPAYDTPRVLRAGFRGSRRHTAWRNSTFASRW